jgi:hypothetical protein
VAADRRWSDLALGFTQRQAIPAYFPASMTAQQVRAMIPVLLVLGGMGLGAATVAFGLLLAPDHLVLPLGIAVGICGVAGVTFQLLRR